MKLGGRGSSYLWRALGIQRFWGKKRTKIVVKAFLSQLGFPEANSEMKIYVKWFIKERMWGEAVKRTGEQLVEGEGSASTVLQVASAGPTGSVSYYLESFQPAGRDTDSHAPTPVSLSSRPALEGNKSQQFWLSTPWAKWTLRTQGKFAKKEPQALVVGHGSSGSQEGIWADNKLPQSPSAYYWMGNFRWGVICQLPWPTRGSEQDRMNS